MRASLRGPNVSIILMLSRGITRPILATLELVTVTHAWQPSPDPYSHVHVPSCSVLSVAPGPAVSGHIMGVITVITRPAHYPGVR